MSLINARNVIAPFSERRNLVTLILIALIFTVVRFSGAKIELRDTHSRFKNVSTPRGSLFQNLDREEADLDVASTADEIKRLKAKQAASQLPQQKPKQQGSSKLDDIEQILGMD